MLVVTVRAAVIGSFEDVARAAVFTDLEHNVLLLTNTVACDAMLANACLNFSSCAVAGTGIRVCIVICLRVRDQLSASQ